MRIIFFGTPYYVLPILEALHKAFKEHGESPIAGVVTQPPKPTGRKQVLEYSEVDKWAYGKDIKIIRTPAGERDLDIKNFPKADVGILASYGNFIPKEIINHFPMGILVVHPSMLPEFRGSSPVPAMIATNSQNIGCTIFKMDDKWDHGPIVTQFKDEILEEDNYQTLRDRLFERSAEVLVQALPAYVSGKIKPKAQDESKASFARMIKKEDAFIPPNLIDAAINESGIKNIELWEIPFVTSNSKPYILQPTSYNLHLFIKAMSPVPGAWTEIKILRDKDIKILRLKILKTHIEPKLTINNQQLIIDEVQLEGKNPVSWEQFKSGYPHAHFS